MPSSSQTPMPDMDEYNGRVFVDVCTDGAVLAKLYGYRKAAGAIIKVCAGTSLEARYVTSHNPSPAGTTLPLPLEKSWVLVSYVPAPSEG